jgi:hypothetical protein
MIGSRCERDCNGKCVWDVHVQSCGFHSLRYSLLRERCGFSRIQILQANVASEHLIVSRCGKGPFFSGFCPSGQRLASKESSLLARGGFRPNLGSGLRRV